MVVHPAIGREIIEGIAGKGVDTVWMQPGTRSDKIRQIAGEKGIDLIEDCVLVQIDR